MDIRFHAAGTSDIPVIQRLSERIWREQYPGIITPAQIEYMLPRMYAAAVVREEIERRGYRYIVVSDRNGPVGYFAFRHDAAAASVLLSKLYLLGSHHAKGIGRSMLQYVREEAMLLKADSIVLFVNKNNAKAIRAYERFGFFKAEAVVKDIGGGFVMDDYRMELRM